MPRRKANTNAIKAQRTPTRRSTRRNATNDDSIPDVYNEMLVEAYNNNPDDFAPSPRPTKRRKIQDEPLVQAESSHNVEAGKSDPASPIPPSTRSRSATPAVLLPQQIAFDDDFEDSDDSDIEFEDVDIGRHTSTEPDDGNTVQPETLQLDFTSKSTTQRTVVQRRKPVTRAERDFRLYVHKWHMCCLLVHVATRNKWSDDEAVQKLLKPLVTRKQISNLHLDESRTQAEQKFAFERAIDEICQTWKMSWETTVRGARSAYWRDNFDLTKEVEEAEDPIDLEDFRDAAKECRGSRDLGAQLFCAMLRSVAVETRLICSLQVLPFSRVAKGETPQKPLPSFLQAGTQDFGTGQSRPAPSRKRRKIVDSPFPIWWVEVFSPAVMQWVPLDPIVRNTINKPRTGFEPPGSDNLNSMSYVIAFEDDGTAKDVTRRYTSMYNAKTRKTRVESTKNGEQWHHNVMATFERTIFEARDVIENAALDRRLVQEGMPKNIQDFKNHPVYVLERHLRQNEVIEPRRECGKFTTGAGKNQKVESVYRSQDVHACRSADGWYRRGRDVRDGEQALKRVTPRIKRNASAPLEDDENEGEREGVGLYAEYQTDVYTPPPVIDGKVPRNGYGNLDIYVRTMIPAGAVHVRHPLAGQAAKLLKIDAVEAVTGFKFKGRQGTAVIDGVVIDQRHTAAIIATTKALEEDLEKGVNVQRSTILLELWKKMHAALRVRQRIHEEYGATSRSADIVDDDDDDPTYEDDLSVNGGEVGGGFLADVVGEATKESKAEEMANLALLKDRAPVKLPPTIAHQQVIIVRSPHKLVLEGKDPLFDDSEDEQPRANTHRTSNQADVDDQDGDSPGNTGLLPEADEGGGFIPEDDATTGGFLVENQSDSGGFVRDDNDDDGAGGFLPEEDDYEADLVALNHAAKPEAAAMAPQNQRDKPMQARIEDLFRPDLVKENVRRPVLAHRQSSESVARRSNGQLLQDMNLDGEHLPLTQASDGSRGRSRRGKEKRIDGESDSVLSEEPDGDNAEETWLEDM